MTNNEKKLIIFREVASALNKANIIPILYGSLGLYKAINKLGRKVNDIDVLVPDEFTGKKWNKLCEIMEQLGFILKNEHEHEFERNGELIAFGKANDLVRLTKVYPKDIEVIEENGAKFRKLSPEQYLVCYKFMLRDSYRQEKRGNADKEKIGLIEDYLKKINKNI
jgi:phosphoribosylanthranilate isomerase